MPVPEQASGGDSIGAPASRRYAVDFEYGIPDVASFSIRDWSWALGVGARTATIGDFGDELGAGNVRLREVVAAYLRRVHGSSVDADGVVVCPGFRHGLNVALRVLATHGMDRVTLEDPGPVEHDADRAPVRPHARPGQGRPGRDRRGRARGGRRPAWRRTNISTGGSCRPSAACR